MLDPNALCGLLVDNRYRLQTFLGNGAFGYVFAADELALGESVGRVAVKLIRPQNDTHRLAVLNEIKAMTALSHPYLLTYRSSGEFVLPSGELLIFLALELADATLEDLLTRGGLTLTQTGEMAQNIATALIYLQERSVVHRDLKPANILRVGRSWKISDFGLARSTAQTLQQTAAAGTLAYMSPDAIDGDVGAPGDIWAFGVVLQECLSGRLPYPDTSLLSFIRYVADNEPFIVPALPQPFDSVVRGCLVKDSAARWTAHRVLATLGAAVLQTPTTQQSPIPAQVTPPASTATKLPGQTNVLPRAPDEPVIDASGKGTYRTFNEALSASPRKTRFWIRPGRYRAELVLDRSVVLLGEGAREQIVIECGTSNCVKVTAGTSVLRGLTLSGVAKALDKRYHAVSVSGGKLTLDDCVVSSDSLACIAVQGAEAEAVVRNCLIAGGSSDGILFSKGAQGAVERCQISGHERHGLHIKEAADPVIRECSLTANRGSGVAASGGFGTLRECEIRQNHKTGVHIGAAGALEISQCTITQNKQQAISVERGAGGTVTNCDLRQNVFGAWAIASGSSLQHHNNKE